MTEPESDDPPADLNNPQVFPGWYFVRQCKNIGIPPWVDVGHLHVDQPVEGGEATETWYLYAERKETGGGESGTEIRTEYRTVGGGGADEIRLEPSSSIGRPRGIRYKLIEARCTAPVLEGPFLDDR